MPKRKINEGRKVNILLHYPSYRAIVDFFASSPSGITGADAIRELIYQFGAYCQAQAEAGKIASSEDYAAISGVLEDLLTTPVKLGTAKKPLTPVENSGGSLQ